MQMLPAKQKQAPDAPPAKAGDGAAVPPAEAPVAVPTAGAAPPAEPAAAVAVPTAAAGIGAAADAAPPAGAAPAADAPPAAAADEAADALVPAPPADAAVDEAADAAPPAGAAPPAEPAAVAGAAGVVVAAAAGVVAVVGMAVTTGGAGVVVAAAAGVVAAAGLAGAGLAGAAITAVAPAAGAPPVKAPAVTTVPPAAGAPVAGTTAPQPEAAGAEAAAEAEAEVKKAVKEGTTLSKPNFDNTRIALNNSGDQWMLACLKYIEINNFKVSYDMLRNANENYELAVTKYTTYMSNDDLDARKNRKEKYVEAAAKYEQAMKNNQTTPENKLDITKQVAKLYKTAADIAAYLEGLEYGPENMVSSLFYPKQSTELYNNAAKAYNNAAENTQNTSEKAELYNNAAVNFKKAGKNAMAELADINAELEHNKTNDGQEALKTAKANLDNAETDLDTIESNEIPTTQHLKFLDYWGSSLKVDSTLKGLVAAAGHVFGFLLTLAFSPIWVLGVLMYNLVSDSGNPSDTNNKEVINPNKLDQWMTDAINNINTSQNLHQRTKDNILKELNSLKDQIDSQKSGWLVKRAIGDNSHYVEKSTVINSITKIKDMIAPLLAPTPAAAPAVEAPPAAVVAGTGAADAAPSAPTSSAPPAPAAGVTPKDFHAAVDQADQFSDNIEFGVVAATRHLLKAMLDAKDGTQADTHRHVLPANSFMKRIKELNPHGDDYSANPTTIENEFKEKVGELLTKTQDDLFEMDDFKNLEKNGHHKWLKNQKGGGITDQAAIDEYKNKQHEKYQATLTNIQKALDENPGTFFENYAKAMHSSETALYGIKVDKIEFNDAAKQYLESKDWSKRHLDKDKNPLAKKVWHRYMSTFAVARIIDPQGNVIRTKDGFVGKIDIECNFTYPNFNSYFVKKASRDSSSTTKVSPSEGDLKKMKSQITDQIKLYVAALQNKANDKNYALILPKPNAFINQISNPDNKATVKQLIIDGVKEALGTLDDGEKSKLHLCLLGMDFFGDVELGSFGIDKSRVSVSNSESGSLIEKLSECGIVAMDPSMGNSSAGQGNGATGPGAWSGKDEQDARQTLGCGLASLDYEHFTDSSASSIKGRSDEADSILKMNTNASGSAAPPAPAPAPPAPAGAPAVAEAEG
jgi:hypothetical protein